LLGLVLMICSFAGQAQQVAVTNNMTDTDPQMVLFLNYIDDNDDCRALDVTVPLSISSIIYDVTSITANGWWASGGSPNLTPPDMKLGTTPFFSGVQVMHVCESGSYTPTNCVNNVDVLRVWDYPYINNCSSTPQQNDC